MPSVDEDVEATSDYVRSKTLRPGASIEEGVKVWSEMGSSYNKLVSGMKYAAPHKTAELAAEMFQDKSNVRVLDLACGTGLVAESLYKFGFRLIDGVDAAPGMIAEAKTKGVYQNLTTAYVGVEKLPMEDNSYDIVTLCGGMGQSMLPCESLHEMIRLVKPDGYIVNIHREEITRITPEYVDRLIPLIDTLEEQGLWRRLKREVYPGYQADRPGLIHLHQVC